MAKLIKNKMYKSNLQRIREDTYKIQKKNPRNKPALLISSTEAIINEIKTLTLDDHLRIIRQQIEDEKTIEVPLEGYQHPTLQNIENILEFSKTFTDTDKVLIHCHAGVSRSTAIAILVLIQHGMGIKEAFEKVYSIRDCMNPNVMIINYGDELLECNGELSDYYNKWSADNRKEYGRFGGQTWDSNTDAMKNILQMFK
jgi:predicted protein tyrosine phosphatase